ncbi:succinate dehydrogenase, hydrophobic membrane anchor protein [Sphingomonas citri]|jgi:succinate dehydrogenase / fumarate reductase, membrane anchor subunit|uniref:Succinate dehydrogenase hydrophobic membrane anchor subunit n=1 Tax=Sphingomonas citri TaxID=2862499 RepID=A0ABS7BP77_9SPHN|nr:MULTISPECIES: succinate dehydrogenase, hydrophobic membrane anchor protein [Sphingomonas]MBB3347812.1 succinate dehydrogenase / fumarate reductase membrane anchor subunit [Sphingomonas sp. BK069]MBB3472610.1 succinate dehydrogenase / fumarate reductase membrane anchor subunit [Sphingomonas sp. BK345]MBW6531412.1 succinate dehydrogenase, hydrophobic membrane anchor protein [Sphingomonas citri]
MTTEIGRVRGLGSAHAGAHHWWHHKITAGTNFLLLVWFLASIAMLPSYDHTTVRLWLSSAWAAVPMALLIASVFYHFRLGLQTVIEDYSHKENRFVLTILLNVFTAATAGVAIFSILKVAFGAAA